MKRFTPALICAFLILIGCTSVTPTPTDTPLPNPAPPETDPIMDPATELATFPAAADPAIVSENPAATAGPTSAYASPHPDPNPERAAAIEAHIAAMTTDQKVASLFWVQPEQLGGTTLVFTKNTAAALDASPVSGVVLFGSNIHNGAQTRALTAAFRDAGGPGFVVAVDEEGGRVSRLGGVSGFPKTPAMGKMESGPEVYGTLRDIGTHLAEWGFQLNFAPVCDISAQSGNPVIGDRAFGADAPTVSALIPHAVRGLLDGGVQACLKHFPGHGAAMEDSHHGAVSVNHTLDQLRAEDWTPFAAGLAAGARVVMVGHIALPAAAGDDTPGSLSPVIVTGYLRGELGFEGLVVTDSMRMGAITQRLDAGEAAVQALLAGCDIVLMPDNLAGAIEAVTEAARSGRLSQERIDQAIYRRLDIFWS